MSAPVTEAHRHAMALPTTHPTHADIAWYVREVSELRSELALLREWQREVIQNANAHHAERKDAIARAESAEREAFDWKKIARYEAARAERAEADLAALQQCHDDNCRGVVKIAAELATAKELLRSEATDDYAAVKVVRRELAAERARLDWLEKRGPWESFNKWGETGISLRENIRAAIDAAMKEGAK